MGKVKEDAGFELREGFTVKEHLFCLYFTGKNLGNATQAAISAGYEPENARQIGYKLKTKVHISAFIKELFDEKVMSTEEALERLGQMARASFEPFIDTSEDGEAVVNLSTDSAKENMHLIRKLNQVKTTFNDGSSEKVDVKTSIDLHDSQKALELLLKVQGKFITKVEHTVFEGEELSQLTDEELDELDNGKPLDVIIKAKDSDREGEA